MPSYSSPPSSPRAGTAQTHVDATPKGRIVRWLVGGLLVLSALLITAYTALSLYIATQLVYVPQKTITKTPADLGLKFQYVTFPSREDHIQLRGWFIPGVRPDRSLTSQRTIIVVHGSRTNRADPGVGILDLSAQFARHGFAVLAFDMRGSGESPPAPLSLGYF
jgi:pimeloyl-ACP methyl ester carboxylesterase